jgi:hydrogenase maturation protein HypF
LPDKSGPIILAVGAHLKNAVALAVGENVFISQHIGDLETSEASDAFRKVTGDLQRLYDVKPAAVICDMHPEYLSTKYAVELDIPLNPIQHHYAHVASCMAENELEGRVLGVSWDGTGYGPDGTIWGGEFLLTGNSGFQRAASFKPFPLPGGDSAIKEPRRAALGILHEVHGDALFLRKDLPPLESFSENELEVLRRMLSRRVNSPVSTSAGRLFDAVASLIGLRQKVVFEGQAAMELEFAIGDAATDERYGYEIITSRSLDKYSPQMLFDWSMLIAGVVEDIRKKEQRSIIAARFHNTLSEVIVDVAKRVEEDRVVLSGGCFQNKYLTERTILRLRAEGFRPYWHQRVPPNDGGIALGQVNAYLRGMSEQLQLPKRFESIIPDHQPKRAESVG